jgi:uncharacterized membrane protein
MSNENPRPLPPRSWIRHNEGLGFDRVVFFTDAVFAIALTLLVVSIAVPHLVKDTGNPSTMLHALDDLIPDFIGFFIAFILIARYWMAHHYFFGQLRAIDTGLISINMVYLAFVAFLPFPSALVGRYEQNPISILLFALCLGIISSLEALQLRHAYRKNLLQDDISPDVYRWTMLGSLSPVAVFLLTAPIAFVSTTLCLLSWLVTIPIGALLNRRAPAGASDFSPSTKAKPEQ